MRRFSNATRNALIVMAVTLVASTCAWLVAISHGLLATVFLKGALGYAVGDLCFYLSLPGWYVVLLIVGYDSGATLFSSCCAVGVNTVLYGMAVILVWKVAQFVPRWRDSV